MYSIVNRIFILLWELGNKMYQSFKLKKNIILVIYKENIKIFGDY